MDADTPGPTKWLSASASSCVDQNLAEAPIREVRIERYRPFEGGKRRFNFAPATEHMSELGMCLR
jgi:hypothetical protein